MLFSTYATLLLLFRIEDVGGRKAAGTSTVIKARLREPLTVDCTFNCSSGFIHGMWTWESTPTCSTCVWDVQRRMMSKDMCAVSLFTSNLTVEQTLYNYSCVSVMKDHKDLPRKIERQVSLQLEDLTMKVEVFRNQEVYSVDRLSSSSLRVPVGIQLKLKCLSNDKSCEGQWKRDNGVLPNANTRTLLHWAKITEEDGGSYTCQAKQPLCQNITVIIDIIEDGDSGWIAILAAVALSVVVVLMLTGMLLCYKKQRRFKEPEASSTVIYENTRTKNKGTVPKPLEQDWQSDHEVPYADIVISVRGSSIPELSGVQSHAPRDHRLRWRDDAAAGPRLDACRSADRLHVHPKEVARKLSTTSEYAVITYSAEALS